MNPREAHFGITPARAALAVVAAVVFFGIVKLMYSSGEAHVARTRVNTLLEQCKSAGNTEDGLRAWYGRHLQGEQSIVSAIITEYTAWRVAHDVNPLRSFSIKSAEETGSRDKFGAAEVLVSGEVNSKPFKMKVQRGQPVQWLD